MATTRLAKKRPKKMEKKEEEEKKGRQSRVPRPEERK
jgi:hypothetical protein